MAGAATTGVLVGVLGGAVQALADERALAVAVGAAGCVLLLADLGLLGLRTPTLRRQTGSTWYRELGARTAWALWGFDLGLGFSTIRLSSLYWLMVLCVAAFVTPVLAPLVLAFYGLGLGVAFAAAVIAQRVAPASETPGLGLLRVARPVRLASDALLGIGFDRDRPDLGSAVVVGDLAAADVAGEPICVVTRITFGTWWSLPGAVRRFRRLRRVGRWTIPGPGRRAPADPGDATLLIVSLWQDELALLQFTTLDSHVKAVRWTIRKQGRSGRESFGSRGPRR